MTGIQTLLFYKGSKLCFISSLNANNEKHEEYESIGGCFFNCWLDVKSKSEAVKAALDFVEEQNYNVFKVEKILKTTVEEWKDTESYEFALEAVENGSSYVCHSFPLYPVYRFDLKVKPSVQNTAYPQAGTVEASYWLAIEKVSDEEEPADNFWEEKTNQERAKKLLDVKLATEAWEIVSIEAEGPTNLEDCDEDTVFEMHYHEAEDCGESIGFWLSNQDSNTVYHT